MPLTLLAANWISDEMLVVISIPIVGGIAIALTAIVTEHRRKMVRDDMNATLKMEMIQRGMSVDEIERVLAARMAPAPKRGSQHGCKVRDEQRV